MNNFNLSLGVFMIDRVSSSLPVDLAPYIAYVERCSEAPKPLSKQEQINGICDAYKQLIALENRRMENPLLLSVDFQSTQTHLHLDNGDVETINKTLKKYHYVSHFPFEEYQKEFEKLITQLEELDCDKFIETLEEDPGTINQITNLKIQWTDLVQQNDDHFQLVKEEQSRLDAEDLEIGFKSSPYAK
jgi:hypothetical protein